MASDTDPSLLRYIHRVQRIPKLSREEERVLSERWVRDGDTAAAEALARAHLRYVVVISRRYRRYEVPLAELIAEGNFGIVQALAKFEPQRGHRFLTYAAYWIRACVLGCVMRSWSLVGSGSGPFRPKLFFRLRREHARAMSLVGDAERASEMLARELGMTSGQVWTMLRRLETRDLSLDSRVFADATTTLVDTMASPGPDQETTLAADEFRRDITLAVRSAVEALDARERFIVENRTMAHADDELSLAELGRRMGVSRERVRQLEVRAKDKLRRQMKEISRASPKLDLDIAV